jgi:hypothetical protein
MTVSERAGYRFCLPMGGSTRMRLYRISSFAVSTWTSFCPGINGVPTTDPNFVDFVCDGMIAFAHLSIDTGSDKEMNS